MGWNVLYLVVVTFHFLGNGPLTADVNRIPSLDGQTSEQTPTWLNPRPPRSMSTCRATLYEASSLLYRITTPRIHFSGTAFGYMATPPPVVWGRSPPKLLTATVIPIALTLIVHPLLPLLPKVVTDNVAIAFPPPPSFPALQANIGFSLLAFVGAVWAVPFVSDSFVAKGLKGRDQCKPGGRTAGPWV